MDIYVVQPGDNINSIADRYGVSTAKLIQDNELENPNNLVPGQTIVIAYPTQTYIVQKGDTLKDIADAYGITIMQLLRNNPNLAGREALIPGETITISYNTIRQITTNGFAYPFIIKSSLIKTLPYLTYLTIYNYQSDAEGNITAFSDDTEIIRTATQYNVVPLMSVSALSAKGEVNIETVYKILLNEDSQNIQIDNALNILRTKGYYGVNVTLNYVNDSTIELYENFMSKYSKRMKQEGFYLFITINRILDNKPNNEFFEKIDYSKLADLADNIIFMNYVWGTNNGPPAPVSSDRIMRNFINYAVTKVEPDKIDIGIPVIGYDWELPYVPGKTSAHSLTLNAAINLASQTNTVIQFDEISQTPFFYYEQFNFATPVQHVVWFIDARSINALTNIVYDYGLAGTGVWNIMIYFPQLWLVIISQYDIIKII